MTSRFMTAHKCLIAVGLTMSLAIPAFGQAKAGKDTKTPPPSSYDQISPTLLGNTFDATRAKDKADKPGVMERHKKLLDERYDLTSKPDKSVKMSRGKAIQTGPAPSSPRA